MKEIKNKPIIIAGDIKLAVSLAICLLPAHERVLLLTNNPREAWDRFEQHAKDVFEHSGTNINRDTLTITATPAGPMDHCMGIVLTAEDLNEKSDWIAALENLLDEQAIIAVNTESIALSALQATARVPDRIIGANWVEPAHTTYFLEVIANEKNPVELVNQFLDQATTYWQKKPYKVRGENGIRARMMCAMIREAFYLVENGYVSFDDIDRACRNDAGYYLPFAGNFRYMDLMGTFIYGIVMRDMNPDLTKQKHVPAFFRDMIAEGRTGMETGHGFYEYPDGAVERWDELARKFSYQVKEIIEKYQNVE